MGPAASPAWERETNKCIGRKVIVRQWLGFAPDGQPLFAEYEGVCVAIQSTHLSVILMTDTEKVIIKNVTTIRRVRSFNEKQFKPATPSDLAMVLGDALETAKED